MGKHKDHEMHPHSLEAYFNLVDRLYGRRHDVFEVVRKKGPMTDKAIMVALGFSDPNAVRPRVSELIKMGIFYQSGEVRDPVSGVRVRVVNVVYNRDPLMYTREKIPPEPVMPENITRNDHSLKGVKRNAPEDNKS